jgi:hypothetical protein
VVAVAVLVAVAVPVAVRVAVAVSVAVAVTLAEAVAVVVLVAVTVRVAVRVALAVAVAVLVAVAVPVAVRVAVAVWVPVAVSVGVGVAAAATISVVDEPVSPLVEPSPLAPRPKAVSVALVNGIGAVQVKLNNTSCETTSSDLRVVCVICPLNSWVLADWLPPTASVPVLAVTSRPPKVVVEVMVSR